jgi:hypothetical protein
MLTVNDFGIWMMSADCAEIICCSLACSVDCAASISSILDSFPTMHSNTNVTAGWGYMGDYIQISELIVYVTVLTYQIGNFLYHPAIHVGLLRIHRHPGSQIGFATIRGRVVQD